MTLHIEQSAHQIDKGRWTWEVWLEPRADLADVERVTYRLHPTFSQPVQEVTDRSSGFRLRATGWGEFMILAEIERTGEEEPTLLRHWLELHEGSKRPAPPTGAPKVLVSSGAADADVAESVAMGLDRMGFEAVTYDDLPVGLEVDSPRFEQAFGKLAGAVFVLSGTMSPRMSEEVAELERRHVPIVPLTIGGKAALPDRFHKLGFERITELDQESILRAADNVGLNLKNRVG